MTRFAIEAGALALPFSGVQRYVVNVVNSMAALLDEQATDERLTLLYRWRRKPSPAALGLHPGLGWQLWHKNSWPLRPRYAAVLCTHDRIPDWDCPMVSVIHDLYQEQGAVSQSAEERERSIAIRRRMIDRSAALLCISEATRAALVSLYPEAAAKASVVPLAADGHFQPASAAAIAALRFRPGLEEPYLLFTGVNRANKNLPRLVQAYAASGLASEFALVLSGPPGAPALEQELQTVIGRCGVAGRVRRIGFVSNADLPTLYSGARACVFPSLVEGFGLPVLEAMRCGVPVLTSRATSCAEVAGGHAVLVDAQDVDDLTRGLLAVVGVSDSVRELARQHAATYSWRNTGERTLAALRAAARP